MAWQKAYPVGTIWKTKQSGKAKILEHYKNKLIVLFLDINFPNGTAAVEFLTKEKVEEYGLK